MKRATRSGFTLIELLVVITIIVVLLALLTPALDSAIYQAELAVCASTQRGVAQGALMYAASYKRNYPYRPDGDGLEFPAVGSGRAAEGELQTDLRVIAGEYIAATLYQDPLCEEVKRDLGSTEGGTAFASFDLWFGTGFKGYGMMKKIGNRFSYLSDHSDPTSNLLRFNLLVGDFDTIAVGSSFDGTRNSHPDEDGILTAVRYEGTPFTDPMLDQDTDQGFGRWYTAYWLNTDNVVRGEVDMNYAADDSSVFRINDIAWDEDVDPNSAGRVARLPFWNSGSTNPVDQGSTTGTNFRRAPSIGRR